VCERRMYVCERARMNYVLYGPSYISMQYFVYFQSYQTTILINSGTFKLKKLCILFLTTELSLNITYSNFCYPALYELG